jgi:hypothetical protein
MKTIFGTLTLLILNLNVAAQDKWHPFTNIPDFGYVFELSGQLNNVAEVSSGLMGLRAGLTFNTNYATGVSFKWSLTKIEPPAEVDKDVFLNIAFTSAYLEYTFTPSNKIHVTLPIDIGVGDVNMEPTGGGQNALLFPYGESYFFYTEPGIMTELNLAERLRLNLGLTYVWVPKLDYRAANADNVSGLCPKIGIKYGRFH